MQLLGQTNSTGKYYYAEVIFEQSNMNSKIKSSNINFGTDYSIQVEKKDEIISKVSSLKSVVDVKNYLSDIGWE